MSKYDRYSKSSRSSANPYKVIYDSSQNDRERDRREDRYRKEDRYRRNSRSRTPPRRRSPSPKILDIILDDHITEEFELKNKNYKHIIDDFKIKTEQRSEYPEKFHPVLMLNEDIGDMIEKSRLARAETKQINYRCNESNLKVFQIDLKIKNCNETLKLIQSQIANYS